MARIRSKDSVPELLVRSLVHRSGFRYRLHRHDLPGRPDLVFAGRRKIIFVHGCFWHGHTCHLGHQPGSHREYWVPKLQRNKARDEANREKLRAQGWDVLVIWECETGDPERITARIREFLSTPAYRTRAQSANPSPRNNVPPKSTSIEVSETRTIIQHSAPLATGSSIRQLSSRTLIPSSSVRSGEGNTAVKLSIDLGFEAHPVRAGQQGQQFRPGRNREGGGNFLKACCSSVR